MDLEPLPPDVVKLLETVGTPPRLRAHLAIVHDGAVRLTEHLSQIWPMLQYDREAVRVGAATHDIGKVIFPQELTGPGRHHEAVGPGVLRDCGFPERFARFARTHGQWAQSGSVSLEDLLVALADTLWKGERDEELEERCCRMIAHLCRLDPWRVSLRFYEITETLAGGAEERLAWQAAHAIE